jgi:hypothetical protein
VLRDAICAYRRARVEQQKSTGDVLYDVTKMIFMIV